MAKITRRITLVKSAANHLDVDKLISQIQLIRNKSINKTLANRGWAILIKSNKWIPEKSPKGWTYKVQLNCTLTTKREREQHIVDNEYEIICSNVTNACRRVQWDMLSTNDSVGTLKPEIYAETSVPKDWLKHFTHIYGRDDQIKLVLSAIWAGIRSDWHDRFHRVLVGPPASGKTEILRGVAAMLGPDSVLLYDGTQTTSAGAIRDIADRQELPRIMIIEEIEKVDEGQLRWLLGVLDHRAEIRKTTFRGATQRTVKMVCLASVNDWKLFSHMMSGALASRFGRPILCPAPDDIILRKVLDREITRVKGNKKWADETMKYVKSRKITDPRIVLQICLCGRDDLLDGSYQQMLDRTDASNFLTARQRENLVSTTVPDDVIFPYINNVNSSKRKR